MMLSPWIDRAQAFVSSPHFGLTLVLVLGLAAMGVLLWSARPGRGLGVVVRGVGLSVGLGVGLSLAELGNAPTMGAQWAISGLTTALLWRLFRECWVGYQAIWAFSWARVGALMAGLVGVPFLLLWGVPSEGKGSFWVVGITTQLLGPFLVLKGLAWWFLETLKTTYLGDGPGQRTGFQRPRNKYIDLWWGAHVRGRAVTQALWLSTTAQYPEFMASRWWQRVGIGFWPDVMEWNTKLGTANMVWFVQTRMDNPVEELEDYSSSGALWSFSVEAPIVR